MKQHKLLQKLLDQYSKHGKLIVAYDFDDTVYPFSLDPSELKDTVDLIKRLDKQGHDVYCYTSNADMEKVTRVQYPKIITDAQENAAQRIAYFRNVLGMENAERESVRELLTKTYPIGILSYVADSEDYFRFISSDMADLKDEIEARQPDANGLCKFVVRPDSSPKTPYEVIVGDEDSDDPLQRKGTLEILWETFGGTVNEKGLRVLNPKVGIIYGEAIDGEMQEKIYNGMVQRGWCVSNLLMGVGSWGFLKNASRDSYSIAIKGTHSVVGGLEVSMQKNPKTALDSKKSACGLLRVEKVDGDYVLHQNQTHEQFQQGELKLAFRDGKIVNFQEWKGVKARAQAGM